MGTHRASDHATDRSAPGRETFSVTVTLSPDDFEALAQRVADIVEDRVRLPADAPTPTPFMTPEEAAVLLSAKRQRVYDLLSQRRLTRVKEGGRTLVARSEVIDHIAASSDLSTAVVDHLAASSGVATALPPSPQTRMDRPFGS